MTDPARPSAGSIRLIDGRHAWEFSGRRRYLDDSGVGVHLEDLRLVSGTQLKHALRKARTHVGNVDLQIYITSDVDIDFEYESPSGVTLMLSGASDALVMTVDTYETPPEDELPTGRCSAQAAPLLGRRNMWVESEEEGYAEYRGPVWHTRLTIGFHLRGQLASAIVQTGLDVAELLSACQNGLTQQSCVDLIRGGFASALIGSEEGQWLEAKREHFDLRSDLGKMKLARSVAQFANRNGGLVVVGLATKGRNGVDTINAISPISPIPGIRRKYVQALQHFLYPIPEGMTVEIVQMEGASGIGELVVIEIPPQPPELQPFLVHGVVIDGRTQGTHILVVERQADEGRATSVVALHAALSAGRALLRHGLLPSTPREASATCTGS